MQLLRQIVFVSLGAPGATALPAPLPPADADAIADPPARSATVAASGIRATVLVRRCCLLRGPANCPLFLPPTELAVGLALKELRNGPSTDSPLRPASASLVPPLPADRSAGTRLFGAAV